MMLPMKPVEICLQVLGSQGLADVVGKLSSPQTKAVLKEGSVRVKLPAGFVSQQKRRQLWTSRIISTIEEGNQDAASELLQQWLLLNGEKVRYILCIVTI